MGPFFLRTLTLENSDPLAEPKLESELHLEVVVPRFEEIYKGGREGDNRP